MAGQSGQKPATSATQDRYLQVEKKIDVTKRNL
jgi:hypothetical protein